MFNPIPNVWKQHCSYTNQTLEMKIFWIWARKDKKEHQDHANQCVVHWFPRYYWKSVILSSFGARIGTFQFSLHFFFSLLQLPSIFLTQNPCLKLLSIWKQDKQHLLWFLVFSVSWFNILKKMGSISRCVTKCCKLQSRDVFQVPSCDGSARRRCLSNLSRDSVFF